MATTTAGRALTEAHRLAQVRLGAQTVRDLLNIFPLLDPTDLDATTARWLRVAAPIIRTRRDTSATLAANYVNIFRTLELGDKARPVVPVLAETVTAERLATSLLVTGPVALKQAMTRGVLLGQAVRTASTTSARAGMRHALNGGRDSIIETVAKDKTALGWARATSGAPCAFCAMLASRGPVYKTKTSAGGEGHRYHDSCNCIPEPVYHRDAEWPPGARQYAALWAEAKTMDGDVTTNFRHLVET